MVLAVDRFFQEWFFHCMCPDLDRIVVELDDVIVLLQEIGEDVEYNVITVYCAKYLND